MRIRHTRYIETNLVQAFLWIFLWLCWLHRFWGILYCNGRLELVLIFFIVEFSIILAPNSIPLYWYSHSLWLRCKPCFWKLRWIIDHHHRRKGEMQLCHLLGIKRGILEGQDRIISGNGVPQNRRLSLYIFGIGLHKANMKFADTGNFFFTSS